MSKEEIFNYFYTNSVNLSVKTIFLILIAAVVIGSIIYATYYFSYQGVSYNKKFNISLVVLLLLSTVIMLMISSNIVISLGMVGALSIVRFRTAIKDSRDTVFIFYAITEGLCIGSQNFKLSLVSTLVISLVLLLTSIKKFGNKYMLIISSTSNSLDVDKITGLLKENTISLKMRSISQNEFKKEIIYEIKTKKELDENLINNISKINCVESVNFVSESGEIIG